jgi:hypothetical protein
MTEYYIRMQKIKQRSLGVEHSVFEPATHDKKAIRHLSSMQNIIQESKKKDEYNKEKQKVKVLFNSNPYKSRKLIIDLPHESDLEETREED